MPALSQSLTFTQNSTSTVVLNYPNDAIGALEYVSDPVKGDGYFGGSDGFHTVQLNIQDFVGKIEMQGTLASEPNDIDWFDIKLGLSNYTVDTTGLISEATTTFMEFTSATTEIRTYNLIGNFVWIRAKVSNWTEGTVNNIRINR
jgi:hypothetical protein